MSKYTTLLRWIVEQEQTNVPYSSSVRYTNATYKKLGLDSYPIFKESYRKQLNDKIIDHFYFREIGFETAALFAWYMRRTMNEIMPYYNELYTVEAQIDDPLTDYDKSWKESWDADVKDTGTVGNVSKSTTNVDAEGTTHNRNVFQDTPMSLLDNSSSPTVQHLDYATSVTYDDGSSTDSSDTINNANSTKTMNTNRNDAGWRVHDEKGRNTSQIELFEKLKDKYMNLDMEIINHLEDLFMGVW